jgi:hypothetical protein
MNHIQHLSTTLMMEAAIPSETRYAFTTVQLQDA